MPGNTARYGFKPGRFSSHGRILHLAAQWPRTSRILEVGTASGYVGRELRALGFTEVAGIEYDPAAAAAARPHYRWFAVADLEQLALPDTFRDFDVLICADVLEHLRDPVVQLRQLSALMRPVSTLVVSLPNVANWTVRLGLLAGSFTYRERGLLDRGHLRFFTRRTARALIEDAGYVVDRCEPTPIPIAYVLGRFVPARLARGAERAYLALALVWGTLFAYQFVFVARLSRGERPASSSPR